MPEWIHSRAEHLLAKNPEMSKSMAFALATQQAHATGHTPKGFGTAEGKSTAKAKYDTPKDDEQRANPGELKSEKLGSVLVGLMKCAGLVSAVRSLPGAIQAMPSAKRTALNEVAGLGVLAVPGFDTLQSKVRARLAGDRTEHGAEKRRLLGEGMHAALDVGGLGMLAAPEFAHFKHAFAYSAYGGQPAQNPPGMRGRSQVPAFTAPELEVKAAAPLRRLGELVTGSRAGKLRDAALRHADRAASSGNLRELKASRKLRHLARLEEGNVGTLQGGLVAGAGLGAVSDVTGLSEKLRHKEAGIGVGAGTTTSQYSGPLSYGPFKMTSGIPAFTAPGMTREDAGVSPKGWMVGENKTAASMNTANGSMSPMGKLNVTQRVGAPKTTGFAGPSIADVAKPKGFGTPISGAQKNQL